MMGIYLDANVPLSWLVCGGIGAYTLKWMISQKDCPVRKKTQFARIIVQDISIHKVPAKCRTYGLLSH